MRFKQPKPTPEELLKYGVTLLDPDSVKVTPIEAIREKQTSRLILASEAARPTGRRRESTNKLRG